LQRFTAVGPGDRMIVPRVADQGNGNFRVDYTPAVAGKSSLSLNYFIMGSAVTAVVSESNSRVNQTC